MICKMTGQPLDPMDAIECGAVCENCPIGTEKEPVFTQNAVVFEENQPETAPKKSRLRQKKWDLEGMRTVSTRLPTRTAMRFSAYCAAQGKTRHAIIRDWIKDVLAPAADLSTVHKPPKDRWGKI